MFVGYVGLTVHDSSALSILSDSSDPSDINELYTTFIRERKKSTCQEARKKSQSVLIYQTLLKLCKMCIMVIELVYKTV